MQVIRGDITLNYPDSALRLYKNKHSHEHNKHQRNVCSRMELDQPIVHMDSGQYILVGMTADFKEGISALIERRKPTFRGK